MTGGAISLDTGLPELYSNSNYYTFGTQRAVIQLKIKNDLYFKLATLRSPQNLLFKAGKGQMFQLYGYCRLKRLYFIIFNVQWTQTPLKWFCK